MTRMPIDPAAPAAGEPDNKAAVGTPHAEPVPVAADEAELRLDRWFRRRFPQVTHNELEKWLRTGQVRIDGRRAKAGDRLSPGQAVRVPPAARTPAGLAAAPVRRAPSPSEAQDIVKRVLHRDDAVLVIDKPAGLAVQGGSKTTRHLDGMLDALRFGGERPRLVHRLDKDTSGVLVLARSAAAATALTAAFASRRVSKLYWAVVVGVPPSSSGHIEQPLAKRFGALGERVSADEAGQRAVTDYTVIERAGRRAAWLALQPRTGRTHQLRAHCAFLGTPILGDGKYGGATAFLEGEGLGDRLHLHARTIRFPHPAGGEVVVSAPLPAHMRGTWQFFGFSQAAAAAHEAMWGNAAPRGVAKRRPRARRADGPRRGA
jgi:23S rRNA pseudouridine955/2504/2580 synthase